ncbi:probable mitochondrial import receptor subunit TOM40-2 isoform X2 [Eutrema salsugineum]|nr:probable mitochondrial import receptor subunit TOM40-2 isoform X2 [Eutrema salsugineum]
MLNHKFFLSHTVMMGPTQVPTHSSDIIKIPTADYEFGANFIDPKLMLIGRVLTDGNLNARIKCNLTDNLTIFYNGQLTSKKDKSQGVVSCDYKGSDYRTKLQIGSGSLYAANYIQHVTPHLSLGGEVFWIGEHRQSCIGYAARYETDKMIASGQVSSSGVVIMNYVHKVVSEKISLVADFMYNLMSRDVTASVGYDYVFRQCRLRGKIDSNGVTSAYLEEVLPIPGDGLRFLVSAEVDHVKKDYKFGFGVTVG